MNPIAPYRSFRARRLCTAALFAAAVALPADIASAAEPRGDVAAKIEYCQDCHGPSGRGYRGFFPIPRLAGQQPEYIKNQLQAFVERRRANSIMFGVAHVLSPAMIAALAADFHAFNPAPFGGAPTERAALGKKIFEDGLPDANIAACAACHGPDATGSQQIPRLAGQLNQYVVQTLTNWDKERGRDRSRPDASATMEPIAHSLNKQQIEAIAAFVSELK